ncbi:uncharacterized protein [Blastocystis hominis]|uniref:Uncharacterized protein n=1 Tax=Blastocystis hominis TaxID=12968 RepID=D8LYT0_BLAHO|nr:uncharacterized protein [Blastocystis hominis]CBK20735.2 unnamed protein product [Blastocystis hominis]|eukprot:XP_012894783.1 uncharacterized protein [Blastocystis hominis]
MDSSQSSLQIPKSQSTKEPIVAKTPAKEKPKVIILTPARRSITRTKNITIRKVRRKRRRKGKLSFRL